MSVEEFNSDSSTRETLTTLEAASLERASGCSATE